jgi:hypothetical protein
MMFLSNECRRPWAQPTAIAQKLIFGILQAIILEGRVIPDDKGILGRTTRPSFRIKLAPIAG